MYWQMLLPYFVVTDGIATILADVVSVGGVPLLYQNMDRKVSKSSGNGRNQR